MTPLRVVDLRSDTLTVPDARMREVMAAAAVGDDVWGEDPTVRALEETVARLLGKEAAMFTPSGTMANLCAVLAQTAHGDEVIADPESHILVYEVGGAAAIGGVQLRVLDCPAGAPPPAAIAAAVRTENIHHPVSRLLLLENTHNRRGGMAIPSGRIAAAAAAAHAAGLRVHCDGARLFNAAVALGVAEQTLVADCDTVSVCFSKGLGAPVGSALAGDTATIATARRWRKRLGGGMRQAGIIAAAALDALERNRARLADDHRHAALLLRLVAAAPGARPLNVEHPTNIVMLATDAPADDVVAAAAARGVLVTAMDRHLVRAMCYVGIDEEQAHAAGRTLFEIFEGLHPSS